MKHSVLLLIMKLFFKPFMTAAHAFGAGNPTHCTKKATAAQQQEAP